ncbi:MAG: DUF1667 domain-containing protein [Saccharofermentans sp.]|nr:DUF1667 domain-containing protein [Saccharofermentans sp.]
MNKEIICINCPVGCRITVTDETETHTMKVSGNECKRGHEYAIQEITQPKRMITAVVLVKGGDEPLSVKTSIPIPKECIQHIMKEISLLEVRPPIRQGEVLISNICETGADIVATKELL